jgi:putative copper export protein
MKRIWVPQLIASLVLLWALNPENPYGYYILLRWVCCSILAYLAFQAFEQHHQGRVWVLGIMASVYNPIVRVHLTREIWSVVSVVTIGTAVASIFALRLRDEKQDVA